MSKSYDAFSFSGHRPLTRGYAPRPRWGLGPQTPSRSLCPHSHITSDAPDLSILIVVRTCPRPCVAVKPPCEPRPAACRGPHGEAAALRARGEAAYNLVVIIHCVPKTRDHVYIARRVCIARTMQSQDVCPSVCLSVCPSVCHTPVLSLNGYTYTHSFYTVGWPNHSSFPTPNGITFERLVTTRRTTEFCNIPTGTPITGASNARGYEKITTFDQYLGLSGK